jgi:hypothetical protein
MSGPRLEPLLPSLAHLIALSDDTGIVQHATYDIPNRATGYCTDDVARAFMVALAATRFDASREAGTRLARIYLAFLADAQLPDGRFHNFMSFARDWLDDVGTDDSIGRAIWSLGFGIRFAPHAGWRAICRQLLAAAIPNVAGLRFIRSRAYAALGLAYARSAPGPRDARLDGALAAIGDDLARRHAATAGPGWNWFENEMTYDNARLPEALLRIGMVLDDSALIELGKRTLDFYSDVVVERGSFVPIGNDGWYVRGGTRSRYAQQPLEAAALVDAGLAAAQATRDERYHDLAQLGLDWFYGRNSGGAMLVFGGGCRDGLELSGGNENMGAESTLAYLASAFALATGVPETAARA